MRSEGEVGPLCLMKKKNPCSSPQVAVCVVGVRHAPRLEEGGLEIFFPSSPAPPTLSQCIPGTARAYKLQSYSCNFLRILLSFRTSRPWRALCSEAALGSLCTVTMGWVWPDGDARAATRSSDRVHGRDPWQWLRGWWTIGTVGGFSRLYDTISKVRARQLTRNEQGPTTLNTTLDPKCVRRNLRPSRVFSFIYPSFLLPPSPVTAHNSAVLVVRVILADAN